jgi:hypothetical protein
MMMIQMCKIYVRMCVYTYVKCKSNFHISFCGKTQITISAAFKSIGRGDFQTFKCSQGSKH